VTGVTHMIGLVYSRDNAHAPMGWASKIIAPIESPILLTNESFDVMRSEQNEIELDDCTVV